MEVMWPENRCELSPNHAHLFRPVAKDIWRCEYCWTPKWTPNNLSDAVKFSRDISKIGLELAYQKWLHYRPGARRTLEKLEDIRLLRKVLPEKQLMESVAAMMIAPEPVKKTGRPRIGEWRQCIDCGKTIYIRHYRIKDNKEHRCKACSNKKLPSYSRNVKRERR